MSVEKSFSDNKRSVRGHDFVWTDKHMTAEQLMPFRQQADDLGLAVVERLLAIVAAQKQQTGQEKRPDLYTVLKENLPMIAFCVSSGRKPILCLTGWTGKRLKRDKPFSITIWHRISLVLCFRAAWEKMPYVLFHLLLSVLSVHALS